MTDTYSVTPFCADEPPRATTVCPVCGRFATRATPHGTRGRILCHCILCDHLWWADSEVAHD